jgi:hypothetical protein
MPNQMSFPGQNPIPPQTDLIALKGAKDVLVAQQTQLQEQVNILQITSKTVNTNCFGSPDQAK